MTRKDFRKILEAIILGLIAEKLDRTTILGATASIGHKLQYAYPNLDEEKWNEYAKNFLEEVLDARG